jgi:hypothetical protein
MLRSDAAQPRRVSKHALGVLQRILAQSPGPHRRYVLYRLRNPGAAQLRP